MSERVVAFAPGRVNLIGEHTDYNGGLSLPFAIERGVTVAATARPGETIEVHARDLGEVDRFALAAPPPAGGWRAFARGACAELQAAGLTVRPARLEISATLAPGAGLSSSAALCAALCLALLGERGAGVDRLALAHICARVEHRWIGAPTGLLDQVASLFGQAEHALRIDFAALEAGAGGGGGAPGRSGTASAASAIEPVALALGDWTLVVVDSGERHAHGPGSGYAARRAECAAACAQLGVASLRAAPPKAIAALPAPLAQRARHVVDENARVEQAVGVLRSGELEWLGPLLDASHASLRDCYAASSPAVEATVAALHAAGARGARIVGGGFGGHVLGLLAPDTAPPPQATVVRPAAGARLVLG